MNVFEMQLFTVTCHLVMSCTVPARLCRNRHCQNPSVCLGSGLVVTHQAAWSRSFILRKHAAVVITLSSTTEKKTETALRPFCMPEKLLYLEMCQPKARTWIFNIKGMIIVLYLYRACKTSSLSHGSYADGCRNEGEGSKCQTKTECTILVLRKSTLISVLQSATTNFHVFTKAPKPLKCFTFQIDYV